MQNRIRLSPHITLGPQLKTEDEWEHLARDGIKSVVNLSSKGELGQLKPDEEAAMVETFGMTYLHHPVSVSSMGTKHVDGFLDEVQALETPMYIHCRLGQRAGPFGLILHAVRRGLTPTTITRRAREHGLVWHAPYLNEFATKFLTSFRERESLDLSVV